MPLKKLVAGHHGPDPDPPGSTLDKLDFDSSAELGPHQGSAGSFPAFLATSASCCPSAVPEPVLNGHPYATFEAAPLQRG